MPATVTTNNAFLLLPPGTQEDINGDLNMILSGGNDVLNVLGNRNAVTLGSGSSITFSGGADNTLVIGSGGTVRLSGGRHNTVVAASGDSVAIAGNGQVDALLAHTVTLSSGKIMLSDAASAVITGNANAITAASRDNITLTGTGNTLAVGSGSNIRFSGIGNNVIDEAAAAELKNNVVTFDGYSIGGAIGNGATDAQGRKYDLKGTTLTITSAKDSLVIHNFKNGDFGVNFSVKVAFKAIFFGNDDKGINQLWITDGTALGTKQLTHLTLNLTDSYNFVPVITAKSRIFFVPNFGRIWTTDGTEKGTYQLFGGIQGAPAALGNNALYYGVAYPYAHGLLLSDGTIEGTKELLSSDTNNVHSIEVIGGKGFFRNYDSTHSQNSIWVTDGTIEGTHKLKDLPQNAHYPYDYATYFHNVNGKAIFNINEEVWITDGTSTGTKQIAGITSTLDSFTVFGNKALILSSTSAYSSFANPELVITDGTAEGTHGTGLRFNPYMKFTVIGDRFLFSRYSQRDYGAELYISDGSARGTHEIAFFKDESSIDTITANQNKALFAVRNASGKEDLWITDGTAQGTKDIAVDVNPRDITFFGDKALFRSGDPNGDKELFVTDGTKEGTKKITSMTANSQGLNPTNITVLPNMDAQYNLLVQHMASFGAGSSSMLSNNSPIPTQDSMTLAAAHH